MRRLAYIGTAILMAMACLPQTTAQEPIALSILSAEAAPDVMTGTPAITLALTKDAQARFANFTSEHVGERTDILVDGVVVTSPVIQTVIASKTLVLSGLLTMSEAQEMAERLTNADGIVTVRLQGKPKSK